MLSTGSNQILSSIGPRGWHRASGLIFLLMTVILAFIAPACTGGDQGSLGDGLGDDDLIGRRLQHNSIAFKCAKSLYRAAVTTAGNRSYRDQGEQSEMTHGWTRCWRSPQVNPMPGGPARRGYGRRIRLPYRGVYQAAVWWSGYSGSSGR